MSTIAGFSSVDARLSALAIELPRVPVPVANFVPFRRCGNLVFLAGQVCEWNGEVRYVGRVGVDYDLADGQQAARVCGLNLIAALKAACGGTLDAAQAAFASAASSIAARHSTRYRK